MDARPKKTWWMLTYTVDAEQSSVLVYADTEPEAEQVWHDLKDEDSDAEFSGVTQVSS